tara:strand:- start:526 stop:1122 length:597 start_codon:yes stop_codon:yes gene_type:complete
MKRVWVTLMLICFVSGFGQSSEGLSETTAVRSYQLDDNQSHFIIKGTSSLHDWEMISNDFEGVITYELLSDIINVEKVHVNVGVTTLESGKKIMNKKCYDALKSDDHPTIKYRFGQLKNLTNTSNNTFSGVFSGTLDIAGVKKNVNIDVVITLTSNSITIKGEKPLKMTDFGVEPPTALLGTLKTGDDIIIDFNLNYH